MDNQTKRKKSWKRLLLGMLAVLIVVALYFANLYNIFPKPYYSAADFNIQEISSSTDYNQNGIDDYHDFLLGARKDAENHPEYNGAYYEGGYPPSDKTGVCTDVIWRAFKEAGYNLKEMVDTDIAAHVEAYSRVAGNPDPNIDFRRVPNLKVFFEKYAVSLTTDTTQYSQWQPGDIVTYGVHHIGIVSDRRNKKGMPYLIHNAGQPRREEDALTRLKISGHYRFDASRISANDLVPYSK